MSARRLQSEVIGFRVFVILTGDLGEEAHDLVDPRSEESALFPLDCTLNELREIVGPSLVEIEFVGKSKIPEKRRGYTLDMRSHASETLQLLTFRLIMSHIVNGYEEGG